MVVVVACIMDKLTCKLSAWISKDQLASDIWGVSHERYFRDFTWNLTWKLYINSKYVTWMFLIKHFRSNIPGTEYNSSGGVIFGVADLIQVIFSNPSHIWDNISFVRNIQVTYLLESYASSRFKKQMLEVHNVAWKI